MAEAAMKESKDKTVGIDILTDARHGWRKNSRQTDVVCIGGNTHQVLTVQVVTSKDDPVAQRHERLGTEKIYKALTESDLSIARHCHDNNASVTKYVREQQKEVCNQLDNWHGLKSLDKHITKIVQGNRRDGEKTWHWQLKDKQQAIHTHASYCMNNCEKSAEKLRACLINCVAHYQGLHDKCSEDSRCRWDPRYEPTKTTIDDPIAAQLLTKAIQTSNLYKNAALYTENMSTAYVESFNNSLNMFQNKRISFTDENYKNRTLLTVLYWNENVNRAITSVWRSATGKKKNTYSAATYNFRDKLWHNYLQTKQ